MLVLSRKPGERIFIGSGVTLTVVEMHGNQVRLGIEAPPEVPIVRAELGDFLAEPPNSRSPAGRRRIYAVAGLCAKG
jgi:carbon storage regulator